MKRNNLATAAIVAVATLMFAGCSRGNFQYEYDSQTANLTGKSITVWQILGEEKKSFSAHDQDGSEKIDWTSDTNNTNAALGLITLGAQLATGYAPNFSGTAAAPQFNARTGVATSEQPNETTAEILKSRDENLRRAEIAEEKAARLEGELAAMMHGGHE